MYSEFPRKIICIDLKKRLINVRTLKEEIISSYIGGRGINILLLYSYIMQAKIDHDKNNFDSPLIIGTGLLTGLPAPCLARANITGISPETGFLGDSNIGGFFGGFLKKAGYSHILVFGNSEEPLYIFIGDEGVELLDASKYWGKGTQETQSLINERHGKDSQSIVIGPAGENLIPFSAIVSNKKNAAARTGMGCLMGKKKLKAIVVNSSKGVKIYDRKGFLDYSKKLYISLEGSKFAKMLNEYGTPFLFKLHNRQGIVRSYGSKYSHFDKGSGLDIKKLKNQYYRKTLGCFACSIKCHHTYSLCEKGREVEGEGPEYGTLSAFGPICGIGDIESILKINNILNDIGLDSVTTGNLIGFLIRNAGEIKGRFKDFSISWGETDKIISLIFDIAHRKGLGRLLSDGFKGLYEYFSADTVSELPVIKGLIQSDGVDVRASRGFALGIATASRGADHLRSRPTLEIMNIDIRKLQKIYKDCRLSNDPHSYAGKAGMVYSEEREYAVGDSIGICRFAQRFNSLDCITVEDLSRLVGLSTGLYLTQDKLLEAGDRINTTERLLLNSFGIDSKDDRLPSMYHKPVKDGPKMGEFIDPELFDNLLAEYYLLHGWNPDGTVPESLAGNMNIYQFVKAAGTYVK